MPSVAARKKVKRAALRICYGRSSGRVARDVESFRLTQVIVSNCGDGVLDGYGELCIRTLSDVPASVVMLAGSRGS